MLSDAINPTMLRVVMLNVIRASVVAPRNMGANIHQPKKVVSKKSNFVEIKK
jgi:hypothetical protein